MEENEKFGKKDISFIVGGAIIGAITGYIIKKIGIKNIINILKTKDVIPPTIANIVNEFTSKKRSGEE